jgi:bacterioferritin B
LVQLISDNLTSVLQEQIGNERYNSSLYLFICGILKNKGLNNLAEFFNKQNSEEFGHSMMIFDLLTDLNAPVIIPEIDKVDIPISSILDIATKFLEREILTTSSLDEIKKLAIDESNCVVEEAMRDMIKIQRKEYEEANDFNDKAQLTGGDWWKVMVWDLGVGK